MPGTPRPSTAPGHHHPVVVVALEGVTRRTRQRPRPDREPVGQLGHVAAERVDLLGDRGQPVGLLRPGVADPGERGRPGGERGDRGERQAQLRDVAQVGVDAVDRARPGDGEAVRVRAETEPPIRVITSRIASAGCSDATGQSRMVTEPPVTRAAARNGPALDRSGSTVKSPRLSGPGATRQESGRPPPAGPASTVAPASRSIRMVISMCGSDGTGGPACCTATPAVNRGAASSRPETSCDDPGGVERHRPAGYRAAAVDGERQRAAAAVVDRHAERAQRGEQRADRPLAGPRVAVERDVAGVSAATAGRNRMTVPALPTSTRTVEPGAGSAGGDADLGAVGVDGAAEGAQRADRRGTCRGPAGRRGAPTASRSAPRG